MLKCKNCLKKCIFFYKYDVDDDYVPIEGECGEGATFSAGERVAIEPTTLLVASKYKYLFKTCEHAALGHLTHALYI